MAGTWSVGVGVSLNVSVDVQENTSRALHSVVFLNEVLFSLSANIMPFLYLHILPAHRQTIRENCSILFR